MPTPSRRSFLALAGAGAASVGVAGAMGGFNAVAGQASPADTTSAVPDVPADLDGSLVAYIEDPQGDSVSLMVNGTEVLVRDKKLVARLVSAASSGSSAAL